MSSTPAPRLSRFNLPRLVLWLASLVVAVGGYVLMIHSNAREAAVYASGTADYPTLISSQSMSTLGGLLVAVGVLGALLALVSLALTRRAAPPVAATAWPAPGAVETHPLDAVDDDDADDDDTEADTDTGIRASTGAAGFDSARDEAPASAPSAR